MESCKYCGQQHAYTCPSIESMNIDSFGNATWIKFRSSDEYERMAYILKKAEKTKIDAAQARRQKMNDAVASIPDDVAIAAKCIKIEVTEDGEALVGFDPPIIVVSSAK